ncbi:hypothetical protein [Aliikangiella sp. IMCC44359]|uniref:hypothetical protein n=1 Tax=Aliikangiella sp. IMCC44359 TaxID=3459125 RepID=UPI00403ADC7F
MMIKLRNHPKCYLLLISYLLFVSPKTFAEMFVHQLNYVSSEQIIPVMKPHLNPKTKLSGKGYQLFIQASADEYKKIQEIIKALDQKPGEYLVEVRILKRRLDKWEMKQTNIQATNTNLKIKSKQITNTKNQHGEKKFRLRISEGYQGFVNTGESFPTHQLINQYQHFIPKSGYKKVTSGFYIVVNQMPNNQVKLSVSAQSQQRKTKHSKTVVQSSTNNQIIGTKNEWILISATSNIQQNNNNRYSTNGQRQNKQWYYVRVTDIIKPQ